MKYSTSPRVSRRNSSAPSELGSNLPMPVTYRQDCMGAATKCYKYLRKLLKFEQMDFEFALWQMIFLFISPQKVYRNFQSRKQTKSQFARDDPAFLVLLMCCICISSIGFTIVLGLGFFQFIKLLFYMIFIDYLAAGLIVATIFWFITNRYLRFDKTQNVEWGYAFDIHLNAFFPPLIILHIVQLFLYSFINYDTFSSRLIGNTIWLIAVVYYINITFLGYTSIEILHKTHVILSALPIILLIYIMTLCAGINISHLVMEFYHYRVV
ncbi:protein unc-50 homolog isoform X2 [Colletes gigas]|uniref:protein unc-50 homolog isoform X2 n=1 Tax=Colletes gigas TaxID=935657 RepID=UPI001C9B8598|nr:protein unc-50 homolog isoform X2 [Colletes gigas]